MTTKPTTEQMPAQMVVEALVRIGKCNERTDNQDLCISRELQAAYRAGLRDGLERAADGLPSCENEAEINTERAHYALGYNQALLESYAAIRALKDKLPSVMADPTP